MLIKELSTHTWATWKTTLDKYFHPFKILAFIFLLHWYQAVLFQLISANKRGLYRNDIFISNEAQQNLVGYMNDYFLMDALKEQRD